MEIIDNAQHKEYASKSLGNTALGFGIAGTAIALLSGGMGLFGLNRNVDIENILSEMADNLINTNPFTFKTSFIGDIVIGGGEIKLNLPLIDKRLVLNTTDINTFKEMLITKN